MKRIRPTSRNAGFTLIELLVVIGLITLLMGLLAVGMGRAGTRAREEATRALIRKVSNQVQERLEALDRLRSRQQFKDQAESFFSPNRLAASRPLSINLADSAPPPPTGLIWNGMPLNDSTKSILWHKLLMKYYFPQSFAELKVVERDLTFYPISVQYGGQYKALRDALKDPAKHLANLETESSELLYFALTHMQVQGIPTVDPGEYKASEVQDTDEDGLPEFVDGWGKPLRFYRWPTRLYTRLNDIDGLGRPNVYRDLGVAILQSSLPRAATPDPMARDQDDPTYALWPPTYTVSPAAATNATFRDEFEKSFHTTSTAHTFMIVSSGPDGLRASGDAAFGLFSPTDQYTDTVALTSLPVNYDGATVIRRSGTDYGFLAAPYPPPPPLPAVPDLSTMSDNIVLRQ